ncbi:hypothetical protein B0T24DRAFT_620786 [Lasiosphaeria ovina]|uniref:Uncharacterized protein n=1 Tax=Lasiosphaeria ovina TaxID=92902 RepID=A0AAE0KIR5_9PEZI|nr:hypothetical protein B0T24DRAFT_620786 [Lasiosphaeria ovina]
MATKTDNVGPLTTVFTGPTTCLLTTTWIGNMAGFYVAAFWDDITQCYPTGTQSLNLHTGYYYSPRMCPSSWAPSVSLATDFSTTTSDYSQQALPRRRWPGYAVPRKLSILNFSTFVETVLTVFTRSGYTPVTYLPSTS